jgi:PAS domain S-box-containing protein
MKTPDGKKQSRAMQGQDYQRLLDFTKDAVYRYTAAEGRILSANRGLVKILDLVCEPEDLVGKCLKDVLTYAEPPGTLRRAAQNRGEVHNFEYHFKTLKGDDRWVIHDAFVTSDPQTGEAVVEAIGKDITERKRAEEALRQSEARFRTIIELAPVAMAMVGMDERIEYINRKAIAVFGYQPDEVPTMDRWWGQAYPDAVYREEVIADWTGRIRRALTEGGEIIGNEYRVTCRDGAVKTAFFSGVPVQDKILVMFDDITERKRAEEALRRSEERYRSLVETTSTGYMSIDGNGIVLDANEEYVRLTGHNSLGEILGRCVVEWTAEADRERNAMAVKSCFDKGQIRNFETTYVDKAGAMTPIEINATRLTVAGRTQIIALSRDITERKRTEQALVTAQQLESLGILAGGIAHDFNNLLGGVFGFVELAHKSSTEPGVRDDLSMVIQTLGRARALTQQLLTFAKGGAPIQRVSSLFPFIQQTAQFALSGSSVSCRFSIADDLWPANYDENQIGQVIDNIVINAQQAMPMGGVIELTARNVVFEEGEHPVLTKGDYVRISVTDSGIGMQPEVLKRAFAPFFTTKAKGHGLGLATCHSIVKRHGGSIDAHSEPGRGSTFTVYLPAAREAAPCPAAVRPSTHRGSGTFLVMDDEEVVRRAMSAMLRSFGYQVVATASGQEAIDHVASAHGNSPPLVGMLFDLTVPGAMGGTEAIAHIRTMGVDLPAFVASGYADDPVIMNPPKYGFTASISKPFALAEMVELLERHMKEG